MKPPIKLVPTLDVQNDLVPLEVKNQIMGLRSGSKFSWTVGKTAKEVAEHGDDYSIVHQDCGTVDHEVIDAYLKSLGVKDGETIDISIWW